MYLKSDLARLLAEYGPTLWADLQAAGQNRFVHVQFTALCSRLRALARDSPAGDRVIRPALGLSGNAERALAFREALAALFARYGVALRQLDADHAWRATQTTRTEEAEELAAALATLARDIAEAVEPKRPRSLSSRRPILPPEPDRAG